MGQRPIQRPIRRAARTAARAACAMALLCVGAAAQSGPTGVWRGVYDCNQGRTGLTLTLVPARGRGLLSGRFIFYAVPENPTVPTGCFRIDGASVDGRSDIGLFGGPWILRPDGYVTVDLIGDLSADGRVFSGRVIGSGCSGFRLVRDAPKTSPEEDRCAGGDVARRPGPTPASLRLSPLPKP